MNDSVKTNTKKWCEHKRKLKNIKTCKVLMRKEGKWNRWKEAIPSQAESGCIPFQITSLTTKSVTSDKNSVDVT